MAAATISSEKVDLLIYPAAALRIKIDVDQKTGWLIDFPHAGSPLSRGRRKVRVAGSPLVIVYRVLANSIRIVRVFHERQDWR